MIRRAFPVLALVLGTLLPASLTGQDTPPDSDREWGIAVTPYDLFASNSTDVAGQKIRQSFSDLASLANAGFQMVGVSFLIG